MTEDAAKTLDHVAAGLRDDTFELLNIEMTQNAMPTINNKTGSLEYLPTGEYTLILRYKRKDT